MQNIKAAIFLYLTQRQKSQLLGTLKSYFKKYSNLSTLDLIDKFIEDEKYYININNPHFEFLEEYFDDDKFIKEIKSYFNFLEYENKQKEIMKPIIEKQKEFAKEQRKKAQEYKMKKLPPTKKQLIYYDKITKNHNIKKHDTKDASRLDLRNWIMEIVNEYDI